MTDSSLLSESATKEWDIALSFRAGDSQLAVAIAAALDSRLRVFAFPRAQENIIGTNGVSLLTELFRDKAKFVVVLFRAGWGDTPWTQVEEQAIVARFPKQRWEDFLLIVSLDGAPPRPWVMPQFIWGDLQNLPLETIVAAITARFQARGVTGAYESPTERLARVVERAQADADLHEWIRSPEGSNAAKALYLALRDACGAFWILSQLFATAAWLCDATRETRTGSQ